MQNNMQITKCTLHQTRINDELARRVRNAAIRSAEAAAYAYAVGLKPGTKRVQAFRVFENLKNALRVGAH